jgi:hypothetical protein
VHIVFDLHAVDDDLQDRTILHRDGIDLVEQHRAALHVQSMESLLAQRIERRRDRLDAIGASGSGRHVRHRERQRRLAVQRRNLFGRLTFFNRRRWHDWHVEADQEPRPARQRVESLRHDFRRLARDLLAAVSAAGSPDPRVQQPQIVVDFRRCPHGRPRVPDAVLLPNRDRRTDAVDAVDVRLLHPLEKLPRVRRKGPNISALPFGIDRVEGQ